MLVSLSGSGAELVRVAAAAPIANSPEYARGRQDALRAVAHTIQMEMADPLTVVLGYLDQLVADEDRLPEALRARVRLTAREAGRVRDAIIRIREMSGGDPQR